MKMGEVLKRKGSIKWGKRWREKKEGGENKKEEELN